MAPLPPAAKSKDAKSKAVTNKTANPGAAPGTGISGKPGALAAQDGAAESSLHQAILVHAAAVNRLAAAIEARPKTTSRARMSQAKKIAELKTIFGIAVAITAASKLSDFIGGGPGASTPGFRKSINGRFSSKMA